MTKDLVIITVVASVVSFFAGTFFGGYRCAKEPVVVTEKILMLRECWRGYCEARTAEVRDRTPVFLPAKQLNLPKQGDRK